MNPAPIDEVVDLLRTLRLPHMRAAAPELLATAKAQRWEPAEAMRALLADLFLSKTRRVAEELTNSCRLLGVVVVVV